MDRRFGSRCGRRRRPGRVRLGRLGSPPSLLHAFTQLSLLCDPHFTARFQFQTCPVIYLGFQVPSFAVMSSEKEFFPLKGRQCRRETWERFSLVVLPRLQPATPSPIAGLTEMGRRPLSVDSQEIRRSENLLHLMRLGEPTNKRALFFSGRLPLCRPAWTFTPPTPLHVSPSPRHLRRRRQHQRIMPCSMLPSLPPSLPSKMLSCRSISIVGRRKYNTTDELRPRMAAQRRRRAGQPSDRAPSERCSSERGRR